MKKYELDTNFEGVIVKKVNIFVDDESDLIILPTLFATHLAITEQVFKFSTIREQSTAKSRSSADRTTSKIFKSDDTSQVTIKQYLSCLFRFLRYINSNPKLSVHKTELLHTRYINQYLNEDLGSDMNIGSTNTLTQHQSAISAYCNFLCAVGIWHPNQNRETTIYPTTKNAVRARGIGSGKIKYITLRDRQLLVSRCKTKRDRLIVKMGYVVGLRTQENCGLTLQDRPSKVGKKPKPGLLSLFDELDNSSTDIFSFYLMTHTKNESDRDLFFTRELLEEMRDYYLTERAIMVEGKDYCDQFFVREDNAGKGKPITTGCASDIFTSLRKELPHMHEEQSYHDLRHSFATDLYYDEIYDANGCEVGNSSAAKITVGKRLGHSPGKNGDYPATNIYVRLKIVKMQVENIQPFVDSSPEEIASGSN